MNGFKIEIDNAGYPIAGSLDDIGLITFIQEWINRPPFLNRMLADITFLDYLTVKKNERLFKNLKTADRIILTHINASVLEHPFFTQFLEEERVVPLEKGLRRGIQVGGVVPYIAGVLVASAVLYLFRRPAVATYKPLSTNERRWVITYYFNTFPNTLQFVVKFTVDPLFINKYRWEYDIYTKLQTKNNGTFNVANFYDWQENVYYHGKPFTFVFTHKKKVYHHIEKSENLMDESFQAKLLRNGWIHTGALIGIYNPEHIPLSRLGLDLDLDLDRYIRILSNVITNLDAAFTIGGLLHGDLKSDNVLINVKTDGALIYDLDFAHLIPYPPAQRKDTLDIERDIHGVFHPTSVNYLFTKKPVPKKISILFLHFFDIFFLAYSLHYGHQPDLINALNRFFQTYYGRNPDFDIFIACFNALSQFRNTYKDPKGYFDYLDYDTLLTINKAVIFSTNKNVFTVYPYDSSTRTVIQDILYVQGWNF